MRTTCLTTMMLAFLVSSPALEPNTADPSPDDLIREVVHTETDAMRGQQPHWTYFLTDDKNGVSIMRQVVETRQGTISRLLCRNRQPISPAEQEAERQHLEQLAGNPGEQQKHFKRESKDQARISELIRMLQGGFRFEPLGAVGSLTRLRFYPNQDFKPANIDQRIFHAMSGTVLVDPRRKRLARITGFFGRDVDFGAGLLGKVNRGGTVEIVRQDVGSNAWNPVELHIGVKGRILFKSLDVRRNLRFSGFRTVRDLSVKEAVKFLEQQPSADCQ